ncbi:MAG: hypothetical protein JWL73_3326 [Actinomycetia bacterium]|nr:hypothetical protein [Actinomycetes bacterium]
MPGAIHLVRHAKAGSRRAWQGPDAERPLTPAGKRQAEAIANFLARKPVSRIVSSPFLRCRLTVEPLGAKVGIPVETDDRLAEGAGIDGVRAFISTAGRGDLVLCSHGDVIGGVLEWLEREGAELDQPRRMEKGSVWTLETRKGRVVRARYHLPA